ncbi:MAG TPA: PQQ-binding-like beta-propeller repeat protein [Verrucomicrobiae bacterium]|nr:PQQ-binding-like beta-propeller repeat protein [Verrucomicrobiae bacterium]
MTSAKLLAVLFLCLAARARADSAAEENWPQWRGPLGTGVAPRAEPPLTWSDTQNIKWKLDLPGEGDSTPIVWRDRVFVLSAVPVEKQGAGAAPGERGTYQFTVFCIQRGSGKVLWQKVAKETSPHEGHQENNTFASASPVTDGKLLWAFFGSRGLYCYDLDGNLKWEKDLGLMKTRMGFGEGASPAVSGDTLVINWDEEGPDFIAAFDKTTGKELWREPRDEPTGWSTPLIVDFNGKKQVVVNATGKVRSYDLTTGKELWSCGGQTENAIPTPVSEGDLVYVTSGFRGSALQAIRLGRTGDLTGTDAIVWSHNKGTPYVPSPLLTGDLLYVLSGNDAMLSCFDAKTGAVQFERERLEGIRAVYASPVSAGDRVYVLGREGACVVLKKGPKPEALAVNKLSDSRSDASMALVGKDLLLRTAHRLYCISESH